MQKNSISKPFKVVICFSVASLVLNIAHVYMAAGVKSGDFILTNKRSSGTGILVCDVYMYGRPLFNIPIMPKEKKRIRQDIIYSDGESLTLFK